MTESEDTTLVLLDLEETAALTHTPLATLRWRRQRGLEPKSFKLGRRVMYRKSDVIDWISKSYEEAAS